MENSELYTFLDNIDKYSKFEIKKKIYSLTEKADIDFLFDLKIETYRYYKYKFIQLHPKKVIKYGYRTDFKDKKILHSNLSYPWAYRNSFFDVSSDESKEEEKKFFKKFESAIDVFWHVNNLSVIDEIVNNLHVYNGLISELLYKQLNALNEKTIQIEKEIELEIDLSGTTIGNKILFLHKLGVIDFLRESEPFNMSINKLATILSAITDVDTKSLQPVLNPLITDKEILNKNHPYYNEKNVLKVEQTLINLGYDLKK